MWHQCGCNTSRRGKCVFSLFDLYILNYSFHRYSYLIAPPEYFAESGLFPQYIPGQPEKEWKTMSAGEAVWFPADSVCHRGVPSKALAIMEAAEASKTRGKRSTTAAAVTRSPPTRKLLFWFSWDKDFLPSTLVPDLDFQLNPWTVYSMTHSNFTKSLVSIFNFVSF